MEERKKMLIHVYIFAEKLNGVKLYASTLFYVVVIFRMQRVIFPQWVGCYELPIVFPLDNETLTYDPRS